MSKREIGTGGSFPVLAATVAFLEFRLRSGATCLLYACQISSRYSRMVRSDENQPDIAV